MPQVQLPIFPAGSVEINRELARRTEGEQVIYYDGHLPVFTHAKRDLASFRLFTSQLIVQGSATQGQVEKAFGVPLVAIKRATKLYRERGAAGFFVPKTRREDSKLNTAILEQGRALLAQGKPQSIAIITNSGLAGNASTTGDVDITEGDLGDDVILGGVGGDTVHGNEGMLQGRPEGTFTNPRFRLLNGTAIYNIAPGSSTSTATDANVGSDWHAPASGFTGTDTFTYKASDGIATSSPGGTDEWFTHARELSVRRLALGTVTQPFWNSL